jgi:ABC-type branched-subunit amino acid transport system substrate-binding protein
VLLVAGLAACGSSSKSTAPSTSTTVGPTTTASSPSAGTSTTGPATPATKTLNIGIIGDETGLLAPVSTPALNTIIAGLKKANATGGVDGYKFTWKIYDSASSPAGGLSAARLAVADHVFAVLAYWAQPDSGLPTLSAAGIPTIGDGDGTGWSGPNNLFSVVGNVFSQNTTAWWDVFVKEGKTKIALPGGTINPAVVTQWGKALPISGASACFVRIGIDGTNTASITAVAHQIIGAHCQAVVSPTLYPGTLQLQIALNQLGGNIPVEDLVDAGPAVIQQTGSSANNLVYANQVASSYATADPGVVQYLDAMKTYQASAEAHCGRCVLGFVESQFFLQGMSRLTGPATQQALIEVLNRTKSYTADGLSAPISFPEYHTTGTLCLSYQIIQGGQWQPVINNSFPFICGTAFGPNGQKL